MANTRRDDGSRDGNRDTDAQRMGNMGAKGSAGTGKKSSGGQQPSRSGPNR